ncbi:Serine/threonine-protein kinase LMTK1 [Galemys pyrenaicus]|uniref:non-specific serine/threonine protein kinase n=1 Tax=Galemys pyrenaicus TaxID=202257 RepID=A0A8J5ZWQ2_GALPY|nr:Serine/threonine-protein kinase LMTK1 [Galemys pyrenaicus]
MPPHLRVRAACQCPPPGPRAPPASPRASEPLCVPLCAPRTAQTPLSGPPRCAHPGRRAPRASCRPARARARRAPASVPCRPLCPRPAPLGLPFRVSAPPRASERPAPPGSPRAAVPPRGEGASRALPPVFSDCTSPSPRRSAEAPRLSPPAPLRPGGRAAAGARGGRGGQGALAPAAAARRWRGAGGGRGRPDAAQPGMPAAPLALAMSSFFNPSFAFSSHFDPGRGPTVLRVLEAAAASSVRAPERVRGPWGRGQAPVRAVRAGAGQSWGAVRGDRAWARALAGAVAAERGCRRRGAPLSSRSGRALHQLQRVWGVRTALHGRCQGHSPGTPLLRSAFLRGILFAPCGGGEEPGPHPRLQGPHLLEPGADGAPLGELSWSSSLAVVAVSFSGLFTVVALMLACLCCKKGGIGFKEFENAEGEEYAADFCVQDTPVATAPNGPDVYVLPLTEVSLPMAKQPGRSVQLLKSSDVGRSSLLYLEEIGHGWFGKVLLGEVSAGGGSTRVVVKELKASASVRDQAQFLEEARPYRALQHSNLLRCLAQCAEVTPYLLVMESCPLGDLKGYLRSCRVAESMVPDPLTLQRMACEVACGVLHLHRGSYVHSDLALRNCLLAADLTVKVGDYGLAHHRYREDYFVTADQLWVPLRWIAPELVDEVHGNLLVVDQTRASNVW